MREYFYHHGIDSEYEVLTSKRFITSKSENDRPVSQEISADSDVTQTRTDEWAYWGISNDLPQRIVKAVSDNAIAMGLLEFIADMIVGDGLWLYKVVGRDANGNEIKEAVRNQEIEDWLEENNIESYLYECAEDWAYFANTFTEFRMNRLGKVASIEQKDASMMRVAWQPNQLGNPPNYFFHQDWVNYQLPQIKKIAGYQESKVLPAKFIYHTRNYFPTSLFYGVASYLGAMRWMSVSSKVPNWHEANMTNAWNIKYHVEMIDSYFDDNFPDLSDQEKDQKEAEFMKALGDYLSGIKNTGKVLLTKFHWDTVTGKEQASIKITDIKNDTNHEAYLPLFTQSNSALCSAFRIDPSIANIDTGNALSNADKRTAYNIYQITMTRKPRLKLLEPLKLVWKINGWDKNIKIGFVNRLLTPLDENKTGIQGGNQNGTI